MGSELLRKAEAIRALETQVRETYGTPQHSANAADLIALLDATLAPYQQAIASMSEGDLSDLDLVLDYLETRPRFHRSGYTAEKLLRRVGRLRLDGRQGERIAAILARIAAEAPSREQKISAAHLERMQADSPLADS